LFDSLFKPSPVDLKGKKLVIRAGTLIDGTGAKPQVNKVIIVENDEIGAVLPDEKYEPSPTDVIVDATDKVVMPGLVDSHVHVRSSGVPAQRQRSAIQATIPSMTLMALQNAWNNLEYGITTIRDMSALGYFDVSIRDAVNEGWMIGPRMFVAGQGLTMYGGHMDPKRRPEVQVLHQTGLANTPDEVKAAARYQISRGVDLIKFNTSGSKIDRDGSMWWPQEMDYEMLRAGVLEAEKDRVTSAAHCHGGQGATDTIRAGVTSIEHGHWLTDEHFELMLEHGTYFCPTLACNEVRLRKGQEESGMDDEHWQWLQRACHDKHDTFERALKAGVPIVSGSDAGMPFTYHGWGGMWEISLLVEYGMTPMQALQAATTTPAKLLGLDDKLGTVEKNMWADLLVLDENPLDDITCLTDKEKTRLVVKAGKPVVDRMNLRNQL